MLALHSFFRWLVLLSLFVTVVRAANGWKAKIQFTIFYNTLRHWTATILQLQLLLGLALYFTSPLTAYFLSHYKTAVHQRELRFFGMEHSSIMILAVLIVSFASIQAKRKIMAADKFSLITVGY